MGMQLMKFVVHRWLTLTITWLCWFCLSWSFDMEMEHLFYYQRLYNANHKASNCKLTRVHESWEMGIFDTDHVKHTGRDHFRPRPCAIGAPKLRMAHSWSSGGTYRRVVVGNGTQIGAQWAMKEREQEREREKRTIQIWVKATLICCTCVKAFFAPYCVNYNSQNQVLDLYFLMSKRNANSNDKASKWRLVMWLQTYSSSALVLKSACFRRKKQ